MIIVYTGNGKGKTSASVGQALRAAGNGLTVAFGQFMKRCGLAGEQKLLVEILGDNFRAAGPGFFHNEKDRVEQREKAVQLLAWARSRDADMLVLDESLYALGHGLIFREELEPFLAAAASPASHLVLSGRNAPDWLVDLADTVTEMREVKHALRNGIQALAGIEY